MPQHVLLGSREPETLQAVRLGLESAGHHVRIAADFEGVVSLARSRKVDLVILAEELHGGTGSDVCAVLQDLAGHAPLLYVGPMLVPGADAVAPEDDPGRILEQAMSMLEGAELIDSLGDMQAEAREPAPPHPAPAPAPIPQLPPTPPTPPAAVVTPAAVPAPAKAKAKAVTNGNAKAATERRDKGFAEALLKKVREADYFEILGVAVEATTEDVGVAHALLRASLADVGTTVSRLQLEEMLAAVDEARDVLSEPALRAAYSRNRL